MPDRIRDNQDASRFELDFDGQTGFVSYRLTEGVITLTHSEVPRALRGRGYGGRLVGAVLAHLRDQPLRVVPTCGFIRRYMASHPEFAALTDPARDPAAQDAGRREHLDAMLDQALEGTFPASDPVAITKA